MTAPAVTSYDVVVGNLRLGDALWMLRALEAAPPDVPTRVFCTTYNRPAVDVVARFTTLRVDEVVVIADAPRIDTEHDYWKFGATCFAPDHRAMTRWYSWDPKDGLFGTFAPLPGVGHRKVPRPSTTYAQLRRQPPPWVDGMPALDAWAAATPDLTVIDQRGWSLLELAEVLTSTAACFVGISSGPGLLAALLGVPTALVHPSFDPRWFGRDLPPHFRWLTDPTPEQITLAAGELRG